jgi:hypothetical protein
MRQYPADYLVSSETVVPEVGATSSRLSDSRTIAISEYVCRDILFRKTRGGDSSS